jgi:phosphatidylglycerophosphatase A
MFAQSSSPEPPIWVLAAALFWIVPLLAILGVGVSERSSRFFRQADPQSVVIDEISGQLITYFGISIIGAITGRDFGWKYLLAGFILFRVFDIWKPWPVRAAERLPGGWGIMADDWVAGIYAALCLWALRAMGL